MVERTALTSVSFVERYTQEYPPSVDYIIARNGPKVTGVSSQNFRSSRTELMQDLLEGNSKRKEMSQALLAEELVCLALEPLLERRGFFSYLAPQNLECGGIQKGVDLIIASEDNLTHLGIDVKLRTGKSPLGRDGYGWSSRLMSPYIYLSLGNWAVDTWEEESVKVKDWLFRYAVPKIPESGKIPKLTEFRQYVVDRIEKSLFGFMERVYSPREDATDYGMPTTLEELEILKEKLPITHALFLDVKEAIC